MEKKMLIDKLIETCSRDTVLWYVEQGNERRKRIAMDDAVGQLCCPITFSLPVDPVTAEDGKVYERSAIVRWLAQNKRSPLTNEPMGDKLLPAHQVRGMIRSMVEAGALAGDKVEAWQQKLQTEKSVLDLMQLARAGDVQAIFCVGCNFMDGKNGFDNDKDKAAEWFEKGHYAGCAKCTCHLGICFVYGFGVQPCLIHAATLLANAAECNYGPACQTLALLYSRGDKFPKNMKIARDYYHKMKLGTWGWSNAAQVDCKRRKAVEWLSEHPPKVHLKMKLK